MRVCLLVNPLASATKEQRTDEVLEGLTADHAVTVVETSDRGDAVRLARDAAEGGAEAVVVLGGDGTANEVANGLAGTSTALAALPGGSTNVFARTIGLSHRFGSAAEQVRAALAAGSVRRIGLGAVDDRYFLFHVGLGFDAAVVEQVERRSALKRRIGQPAFAFATLSTWFRHYDRSRPRFRVHHAEGVVDDGYFSICLNSNPYTFVGPRPLNLAAGTALDGPLAMVTFRTAKALTVLALIGSALGTGRRLRSHPLVDYRPDVTHATVTGYRPFPYQVDGDLVGEAERVELRHHPDALDVVWPLSTQR